MSDLVVLDFNGIGTADEDLTKLRSMQKEHRNRLTSLSTGVHQGRSRRGVRREGLGVVACANGWIALI
jgi:uncharacterized membrane protein